jgi:hypothetical protein
MVISFAVSPLCYPIRSKERAMLVLVVISDNWKIRRAGYVSKSNIMKQTMNQHLKHFETYTVSSGANRAGRRKEWGAPRLLGREQQS